MKKPKKYCETKGKPAFDWNEFLNRKRFTSGQIEDAYELAGTWVTCACGNLCSILPRTDVGAPIDPILNTVGYEFTESIERILEKADDVEVGLASKWIPASALRKQIKAAKKTLARIESRSTKLLLDWYEQLGAALGVNRFNR